MLLIFLSASLLLLVDGRATSTKPCLAKCPADHKCQWKAVSDAECYNPPCGEQPTCVPDVPTITCANVLCSVGTKCIETPTGPQCVEAEKCTSAGCLSGFKCDTSIFQNGACVPVITCASTTCSPDSICQDLPNEDATCVPVDPITCATILCAPNHMCVDEPSGSKCIPFTTCKTSTCPSGKKCVDNPESSATCQPVVTCASTSCPVGSTCVDFPNKDAKCQTSNTYGNNKKCTAKCSTGQRCVFRPTPASECYNPPCADVPTCVSALSDDETSCETKQCYAGYKCVVQLGLARCVFHRTCEELNCPTGQRCEDVLDNARCVPIRTCQALRCPSGQICSEQNGQNAVCRPIQTCATLLCNSKQVCRAGNGREDAICVDGVATDPCASTTCVNGQSCQAINGKAQCVPNTDIATPSPVVCNCRAGEKCVARAVVCVRAPCLPVLECRKARECSVNEVFTDCAGCEPTCANQNPICTLDCKPARCVCRNGFVRDYSGVCVSARACSRRPDAGVPNHLNNCELLRCPVASSCFDYGDRAECLYGPLRDDSKLTLTGGPIRTISPVKFTIPPRNSCQTVKCSSNHECVETSQGPKCQEIRYTISPITAGLYLSDNTRVTISPIRLQSCAAVSCPGGYSCFESKKGPVCEPARYTIGPVTPRYQLYDSLKATVSPIRLTGCHTVKCSAGYQCVETPRGGVCQPTKVKGSCSTVLLHCISGNACKDTPDGPRCLPVDTASCNCPSNQKCVATPVTCITTPCNPILSCQPLTQCGINEEWRDCSSCDLTCANPDLVCPAVCGPPRCQCRNGFARDQTGMCVALKQCSKQPIGVKPATYCEYLRSKCTGTCYDYMDRAECVPSSNTHGVYADFRPTFNCSHVNCPDQLGCLDTPRGPLCVVLKCAGVTCPSDLLCRETRDGPKCVPPFIYTDNVVDGLRHGYGGFSNNYVTPPAATCELVDCRSGHRCINTPTGPICVPGATQSNAPPTPKATCAVVDCQSGHRCMETAAGPICIPGIDGSSTSSCATTKCAPDNRCEDTIIGPLCIPNSNSNNSYSININCVCGSGEECVLVQQSCSTPPCVPKSECRPKTGVPSVKPSITCANVRCTGNCIDTPTGPQCTSKPTPATCASTSCLVGHKCVESPTGAQCVPSYSGGSKACKKANEVLNGCGNHCEGSCEFVGENRICTADCRPPACACKTGFYRNSQGECVPASECPAKEPICIKPNEEVGQCGNHCEGSCDFVDEPRVCTADCRPPACACKSGFYRNGSGDCVPASQCPSKLPVCSKPNEELNQCGNHCEDSCQFVEEARLCTADCKAPACACKAGYYRTDSGDCVIARLCPPKAPVCTKPNEVVGPCGNHCEQLCRFINQPQACTEDCRPPACMCKEGFYRNDNGDCVSGDQCTTQNGYGDEPPPENNNNSTANLSCSSNERVNQCGNLCEAKCEHIGKGPVPCVKICAPPACVCKDGFFRNKKGVCVGPNSCPNSPTYMGGKGGDGRIPYRH